MSRMEWNGLEWIESDHPLTLVLYYREGHLHFGAFLFHLLFSCFCGFFFLLVAAFSRLRFSIGMLLHF